jgi:hypothetical protein
MAPAARRQGLIEPKRLLDDPDPAKIEQAAVWQLSRALNIGRVIAFVGSGVPMAYGRITWQGLVETLADQVLADFDQVDITEKLQEHKAEKERLGGLRDRAKTLRHGDAGTDQYPTLFQLAELLDQGISNILNREAKHLRTALAIAISDDRGQGRELFRRAFRDASRPLDSTEVSWLAGWFGEDSKFDLRRVAIDPDEEVNSTTHQFRLLFSRGYVERIADAALIKVSTDTALSDLATALRAADCAPKQSGSNDLLLPPHRFAAAALLRLAGNDTKLLPPPAPSKPLKPSKAPRATPSRADMYHPARDPLLILHQRLRINRFLTTNYDMDIERLFRDRGYVTPAEDGRDAWIRDERRPARTDRLDGLGGRSRDLVLTRSDHGRLLDFATQDRPGRPQLVHLHGRATVADGDDVVVTEQDYQALYQREDDHRQPMDVARRVTFGGNPLLFVGLGMGEDDILRPLRQFMGQESRLGDRLAVAIMPGRKVREARLLEQMTLLNRYGVYGIYYGAATLTGDEKVPDWMARVIDIADAAKDLDKKFDRTKPADTTAYLIAKDSFRRVWEKAATSSPPIVQNGKFVTPIEIDGLVLEHHAVSLSFELGVLEAVAACVLAAPTDPDPGPLTAIGMAAEGVVGALYSVCLSARLEHLGQQWDEWKHDWFDRPTPRDIQAANKALFKFTRARSEGGRWFVRGSGVWRRHLVPLSPLPSDAVIQKLIGRSVTVPRFPPDRFYANPPSRAMQDLNDGLHQRGAPFWNNFKGRRIYLLLSQRGAGKGHVLSSMASPQGLPRFLAASWGEALDPGRRPNATYAGAAFYGLSLSHEVASVFDRLAGFLHDHWSKVFEVPRDPEKAKTHREIAEELTSEFKNLVNNRMGRLRQALHAYRRAREKLPATGRRVLVAIGNPSTLYDSDGRAKNTGLHRLFDSLFDAELEAVPIDLVLLCAARAVPPQFRKGNDSRVASMLRIMPSQAGQDAYIRVEHEERALDLVSCTNDPPVPPEPQQPGPPIPPERRGIVVCHMLQRANQVTLAAAFFPRIALVRAAEKLKLKPTRSIPWNEIVGLQRQVADELRDSPAGHAFDEAAAGRLVATLRGSTPPLGEAEQVSKGFDTFSDELSGNRYGATLLLAAADEQIGPRERGLEWPQRENAERFLTQAETRLKGTATTQKDAVIAEMVLAMMDERHRTRQAPPFATRQIKQLGPTSHRLLLEILWHVAVINGPVEAEVLATCPGVAGLLTELSLTRREIPAPGKASELLQDALDLLVHRCLLMIAASHGGEMRTKSIARYGIHRLMQRVVFRLLDAPLGGYPAIDRFSVSLYYAQPSDLPRPSLEAHRRLRKLVETLSGHGDDDSIASATDAATLTLASRKLRAALGILCSVYHVAIIGRFDEYESQEPPSAGDAGHFEQHRLLVRNLLRQSLAIDDRCADLGLNVQRPFYAEEIIWLLNESGVLSLAQGRMNDATALFAQAMDATKAMLAPQGRSLAARIGLNAAIADIERGAAERARETLGEILSEKDEHEVVRGVAHGLLGLTDHLAGELEKAEQQYVVAHELLMSVRSTRAASIFMRFRGDVLRARGDAHFEAAEETFALAENLAREGGHEDAAQLARLARTRLLIARDDPMVLKTALVELDVIERYARNVGLPRIMAELTGIRAEAVLQQGETHRSTELAAQSLELSTLHDMRLFKVRALGAVAGAFARLRMGDAAELVRQRAEDLARRSRYTSMVKRLSGLFDR